MQNNYSRFFSNFFLIAILFTGLSSCKTTKDSLSSVEEKAKKDYSLENALLWEVTGHGLKQPSYVYGTIHIINDEDYFLPKGALAAIDASEEIIFEIDMNDMNDMSKQMGMLKDVFMKDDLTLKDLMEEADYILVSDHFSKLGLPIFFFERMKPMFLTVFASSDFDPSGIQNGSMKSYEMEFFEIANKAGKKVGGLESIEYQLNVFDKIPYKDQADMLLESIKTSGGGGGDQFKEMVDIYKAQNIDAMITMIGSEEAGMSEYEDILVGDRNKNWIPIMEEKMKVQTTFFAVGAGHLAGKDGVIHLLKNQGYKLKPLSQVKS